MFVCFEDEDDVGRVVFSLREQGRRYQVFVCLFVCLFFSSSLLCFLFSLFVLKMRMTLEEWCFLYESRGDAIKFFFVAGDKSDVGQ